MNTNNIFITNDKASLDVFKDTIEKTSKAIIEAYNNDKAYTGPQPFDLKKAVKGSILPPRPAGPPKG